MQQLLLLLFCVFALSQAVAGTYSVAEATEKLMYSYASYCHPDRLQTWECYWCTQGNATAVTVRSFITDIATNTFGFVGTSNESVVISFRGTQPTSIHNVITDLTLSQHAYYKNSTALTVHSGFYDAYQAIRKQVLLAVEKVRITQPHLPILVTGHSLGAALAQLCALDLVEERGVRDISVWNFGQPRVGNPAFAKYYSTKIPVTWRTVNSRDIIPHFPPLALGFYHSTTEVWLNNNNVNRTYTACSRTNGEDSNCADSLYRYSVEDHYMYLGFDEFLGHWNNC